MIDKINAYIGRWFAWLVLAMVLLTVLRVIQRYFFASNAVWQSELVLFLHSFVFLVLAGFTLQLDKHVRVDVLYERFSERRKAWVNLIGTLLFLLPLCGTLLYVSYNYVLESWRIHEASREHDGMPGFFILKTFIWGYAITLALQGVVIVTSSFQAIARSS